MANRKLQAELAAAEAQARGPLREEVIRLSYADPEEVAKTLQGILGIPAEGRPQPIARRRNGVAAHERPAAHRGAALLSALRRRPSSNSSSAGRSSVSVSQDVLAKGLTIRANKATNSIFLRLHAADLERIKKLVREYLDVPLPQVKIEARMEILDRTALEAIGIQWGGAGAGNVGRATVVGQGFQSPAQIPGHRRRQRQPGQPELEPGGLLPDLPGHGAASRRQSREPADLRAAQRRARCSPPAVSHSASSARTGTSTSRFRRLPRWARRARSPVPRS